jgi:CubicO group peptidase (beta-lactamase class C family)
MTSIMSRRSGRTILGTWLMALLLCSTAGAQATSPLSAVSHSPTPPKAGNAGPSVAHELTAEDLSSFFDGIITIELERDDIAGAVIAVVKDGNVLFEKGYGYADVTKKTPVSAKETLFRPGSVSKLFTGTAVMQIVEEGKLDLDRDVNDYLDFKIPARYAQPITLRNLLTHTAGFEDATKDLFSTTPMSLGRYVETHIPARIFPPGTTGAYSNYGVALAGYVVQRVSGEPFDRYVANHIFDPLGMTHSTFTQPLPPSLAPLMSEGYALASGSPKPFELIPASPAGGLSASGDDMARFMIAHLQDGRYDTTQILRPETAQTMHSRQYAGGPELNGIGINFFEESRNGHHIIGHGGDTGSFHSHLHLILDANVGFFISLNSAGRDAFDAREAIWDGFLDRYFPYSPPATPTLATAPNDARALTGYYETSRRGETTFLRLAYLIGEASVSARPDGTVVINPFRGFNGRNQQWREIRPRFYQRVDDQDQIEFQQDSSGRMRILTDAEPFVADRVPWYESQPFLLICLASVLLVFPLALLFWTGGWLVRRHYGRPLLLKAEEQRLRVLVRLICAWDVVVILGWAVLLGAVSSALVPLNSRLDRWFWILEFGCLIGALATIIVLVQVCKSWLTTGRGVWSRIGDALILFASIAFAWLVWIGHLANFNLHY